MRDAMRGGNRRICSGPTRAATVLPTITPLERDASHHAQIVRRGLTMRSAVRNDCMRE